MITKQFEVGTYTNVHSLEERLLDFYFGKFDITKDKVEIIFNSEDDFEKFQRDLSIEIFTLSKEVKNIKVKEFRINHATMSVRTNDTKNG